jgi:hypothetical protein
MGGNMREDVQWSRNGSLLKVADLPNGKSCFYDLQDKEQPAPKGEEQGYPYAGLSPDGHYLAGDSAGEGNEIATEVLDAKTRVSVTVPADAGMAGRSVLDHDELNKTLAAAVAGESKAAVAETVVTVDGPHRLRSAP